MITKLTIPETQALFDAFDDRVAACAREICQKPAKPRAGLFGRDRGTGTPKQINTTQISTTQVDAMRDYLYAYCHSYEASGGRLPTPWHAPFDQGTAPGKIRQAIKNLPPNLKTLYFKQWADMEISDAAHVNTLFGEAVEQTGPLRGRVYYKVSGPVLPDPVAKHLTADGTYKILSNRQAARVDDPSRVEKISSILVRGHRFSKTPAESEHISMLQKEHQLFLSRVGDEDVYMVASVRPEDIVRCSTARPNMYSCLAENSRHGLEYAKDLPREIQAGSVVFYLISGDDPHINRPFSRVLAKPAHNRQMETILLPDNNYGVRSTAFVGAVMAAVHNLNKGKSGSFDIDFSLDANVAHTCHTTGEGSFNFTERKYIASREGRRNQIRDPKAVNYHLTPAATDGRVSAEQMLELTGTPFSRSGDTIFADKDIVLEDLPIETLPDMGRVIAGGLAVNETAVKNVNLAHLPEAPGVLLMSNPELEEVSGHNTQDVQQVTIHDCPNLRTIDADAANMQKIEVSRCQQLEEVRLRGRAATLNLEGATNLKTLMVEQVPDVLMVTGCQRPPKVYAATPEAAAQLEAQLEASLGMPCPVLAQSENTPDTGRQGPDLSPGL